MKSLLEKNRWLQLVGGLLLVAGAIFIGAPTIEARCLIGVKPLHPEWLEHIPEILPQYHRIHLDAIVARDLSSQEQSTSKADAASIPRPMLEAVSRYRQREQVGGPAAGPGDYYYARELPQVFAHAIHGGEGAALQLWLHPPRAGTLIGLRDRRITIFLPDGLPDVGEKVPLGREGPAAVLTHAQPEGSLQYTIGLASSGFIELNNQSRDSFTVRIDATFDLYGPENWETEEPLQWRLSKSCRFTVEGPE